MPLRQQNELRKMENELEDPIEDHSLVEAQLHWGEEEPTLPSSSSSSVSSSYSVLFLETLEEEADPETPSRCLPLPCSCGPHSTEPIQR